MSASQKTALVTGCSSGFGESFVRALLADGWRVIATARKANERDLFGAELKQHAGALEVMRLDVTDAREREAARVALQTRFGGRLDLLVNNAGYALFGALEDITEEQLRAELEVNFFGVAFLTRELLPLLRAAGGRVINVSSVFGYVGFPLTSAYCASKFALEGLSESLHHELAPHGVQLSLLEPGGHRTRFGVNITWAARFADTQSPYRAQSERYHAFRQKLASGKGTPADGVTRALMKMTRQARMPLRVRVGNDARWMFRLLKWLPEWASQRVLASFYRKTFA